VFQQPLDNSSVVVTAGRLINSPAVRVPCRAAMPAALRSAKISITPLGQADVINITGEAGDPNVAANAANAFANCTVSNRNDAFNAELKARIADLRARAAAIPRDARQGNFVYAALQQQLGAFSAGLGSPNPTIGVLSQASPPAGPSWPRPKLTLAASLLVALLGGIALAFFLEFATPRIGDEDDLRQYQRLPILARIPRLPRGTAEAYLAGREPLPAQAWKSYRVLRAVLAHAGNDGGYPRTIVVTSAMPGEGKTTTAINLALTLARADVRVILVDADVHRPMLASFFNIAANRNGLKAILSGAPVAPALVAVPLEPNLKLVLSAADATGYAGLTEERARTMLDALTKIADVVVIDAPPVSEVAEVLDLASVAEAVLLAVRVGRTRRDKRSEARDLLARRGVNPAGFVVTTRRGVDRETHYDYPGDGRREPEPLERVRVASTAAGGRRRRR
jgi:capsular exopolysaccharide synthesis family protein